MTTGRNLIREKLHANRPHLSESLLKTYTSVLYNLYKQMTGNANISSIDWYHVQSQNILEYLNANIKKSTRKSVLSALYVLTGLVEYQEQMIKDAKEIK